MKTKWRISFAKKLFSLFINDIGLLGFAAYGVVHNMLYYDQELCYETSPYLQ